MHSGPVAKGIKTFFIGPDISMISDSFIETSFLHGFESYLILEDQYADLELKVRFLVDSYPGCLLFFTIDKTHSVSHWVKFIKGFREKYPDLRIGVLYKNVLSPEMDNNIKQVFLVGLGISAGCIPLQFSAAKNEQILLGVLANNQASGTRKSIRLTAPEKSRLNMVFQDIRYDAGILDISISHFSCRFIDRDPKFETGQAIPKIQILLSGILFMVSAVVALVRPGPTGTVYVFLFKSSQHGEGLDDHAKLKLNALICRSYQDEVRDLLNENRGAFAAREAANRSGS